MTVRIAMWSGPRNLSTAMMRSFGNRADCAVIDEPFYAAYLLHSGAEHPMREEIIASQQTDWRDVADGLTGAVPGGKAVFYQKHMTHHMLSEFGRGWMAHCRNAFLIRAPEAVLGSYARKREVVTLRDIGVPQQREIFDAEADRLGHAPPVVDAADIRADPDAVLRALCTELDLVFDPAMLCWPAGPRPSDGIWAKVWYGAVEQSTGFEPHEAEMRTDLPPELQRIADAARPHYEYFARFRVEVSPPAGRGFAPAPHQGQAPLDRHPNAASTKAAMQLGETPEHH